MKIKISDLNKKLSLLKVVDLSINDKLSYSVKKLNKLVKEAVDPVYEKYNSFLQDARFDLALTDDKGVLDLDDKGGFKFTKDSLLKLNKITIEVNKSVDDTDVTFEPYFIDINHKDYSRAKVLFDEFSIEELSGLFIK